MTKMDFIFAWCSPFIQESPGQLNLQHLQLKSTANLANLSNDHKICFQRKQSFPYECFGLQNFVKTFSAAKEK